MDSRKTLALFDLDGTLTRRDTMFDFLFFATGPFGFIQKMLRVLPALVWYYIFRGQESQAKEILLSAFLKGQSRAEIESLAKRYADRMDQLLRPEVWEVLLQWQRRGAHVVVVTASLDLWTSAWCQRHGLDLISSRGLWEGNVFSGRLNGPNCRGEEKVRRIREKIHLESYDTILAWGDSRADEPMLRLAQQAYFRGKIWNPD
ncbi:MAG: HAD-IB family hydrolase [Flavobacteriales bacterium]|nr:HAD-IB family hydrolase [Flavobacteriales bacterium]